MNRSGSNLQKILGFVLSAVTLVSAAFGALTGSGKELNDPPCKVLISEVMASNKTLCLGCDDDWVELYNGEEETITLDGYYLTDDLDNAEAYSLSGITIKPGEYYVVVLNDAPFGLSTDGESVYIMKSGRIVCLFPQQLDFSFPLNGL